MDRLRLPRMESSGCPSPWWGTAIPSFLFQILAHFCSGRKDGKPGGDSFPCYVNWEAARSDGRGPSMSCPNCSLLSTGHSLIISLALPVLILGTGWLLYFVPFGWMRTDQQLSCGSSSCRGGKAFLRRSLPLPDPSPHAPTPAWCPWLFLWRTLLYVSVVTLCFEF